MVAPLFHCYIHCTTLRIAKTSGGSVGWQKKSQLNIWIWQSVFPMPGNIHWNLIKWKYSLISGPVMCREIIVHWIISLVTTFGHFALKIIGSHLLTPFFNTLQSNLLTESISEKIVHQNMWAQLKAMRASMAALPKLFWPWNPEKIVQSSRNPTKNLMKYFAQSALAVTNRTLWPIAQKCYGYPIYVLNIENDRGIHLCACQVSLIKMHSALTCMVFLPFC